MTTYIICMIIAMAICLVIGHAIGVNEKYPTITSPKEDERIDELHLQMLGWKKSELHRLIGVNANRIGALEDYLGIRWNEEPAKAGYVKRPELKK